MRIILIGAGKLGNQLYKSIISNKVVKIIQWVNRSAKKNETSEELASRVLKLEHEFFPKIISQLLENER